MHEEERFVHYSYEHMRDKSYSERKFDKEAVDSLTEDGFKKQDIVEYDTMLEGLEELSNWCGQNNKADFFAYFQDALIGSFYRFRRTKKKAWPKKRQIIVDICKAVVPVLSAAILTFATTFAANVISGDAVLPETRLEWLVCGTVGVVVGIIWIIMHLYKENDQKREYTETWVRHSLCNSRLQLAMNKFLVSDRTMEDYEKFANSTFAILEQNLEQFAVNMCPKGVASRSSKSDN